MRTILRALLPCILAPGAVALAQNPPTVPTASPGNPLSAHNRYVYSGVKAVLLRSAVKMPEENYSFFSYLLLRGRMIPVPLAWLGVVASVLLLVVLPTQLLGFPTEPVGWFLWLPMLVFEVTLGLWLIVKGAAAPATR